MKISSRITSLFVLSVLWAAPGCRPAGETPGTPPSVLAGLNEKPENAVVVSYIANEGVLIASGNHQVLIDALHKPYQPAYLPTPPAIESKIMRAEKPFDSIDFLLVSHVHKDHFDAQTVARYLEAQQEPVLFSSSQVIDSVLTYRDDSAVPVTRLKRVLYQDGKVSSQEQNGVIVNAGKVSHGSARFRWVENLGHVVEAGGLRFLHVGDPGFGRADIARLLAHTERPDVAILPVWFLTESDGRKVIDEVIQPGALIFVHVSPGEIKNVKRTAARHYPEAVVFSEPMQSVRFD